MKFLTLAFFMLTSTLSFASLGDTRYEARHIKLIEKAIAAQCGSMQDLVLVSKTERIHRVDQGIHDVYYVTVLAGVQRNETYKIKIASNYADMYDHVNQDWGRYAIDSVDCSRE